MPSPEPRTTRGLLLLLATAIAFARRSRAGSGGGGMGVRLHVQRLQKVTPIHQFAPAAGNRALFDRDGYGPFDIRIVAQRDLLSGRLLMVPVDERVLAGWLG